MHFMDEWQPLMFARICFFTPSFVCDGNVPFQPLNLSRFTTGSYVLMSFMYMGFCSG